MPAAPPDMTITSPGLRLRLAGPLKTDAATRPNHGFLTPDNWRKAFEKAGFEKPAILPDVEALARHYDSFFVAAVTARRSR